MTDNEEFSPEWFSKPGDTIVELMAIRDLTVADLADATAYETTDIREILSGTGHVTDELAEKLGDILGGSGNFWRQREANYRRCLRQAADRIDPKEVSAWLKQFEKKQLADFGWVPRHETRKVQLEAYLAFFSVATPQEWEKRYSATLSEHLYRTSQAYESDPAALSAWLRRGEVEAASMPVQPFSTAAIQKRIPAMRELTRRRDIVSALRSLQRLCGECGIALAYVQRPKRCVASGAMRVTPEGKTAILLSFRHRSEDHFWFSFFHELGHVLMHRDHSTLIDEGTSETEELEAEANAFSANVLVPRQHRDELEALPPSPKAIIRFARKIGISAGIVVGQMEFARAVKPGRLTKLKRRYTDEVLQQIVV
ncbi:MAG: ImmA/IrrE family metallo-endopeptidase [Pseudomonadota bacterium]